MNRPQEYLWFDGAFGQGDRISLDPTDPALLFGATVFTTLRVHQNDLDHPATAWQPHCDRLAQSLQHLQWATPSWSQIRQGAAHIARHWPVLRLTCFPDGRELILGRSLPAALPQWRQHGVVAWVAPPTWGRSLPGHKTGNYLACWQAKQLAQHHGAQEAILTDTEGHWLETSTGTLWGWAEGHWWTPPLAAGILPGVMRSHLMAALQTARQPVGEVPWTGDRVAHFTHLAYSNSVVGLVPIRQVLRSTVTVNYNPDHRPFQGLWRLCP